MTAEPAANPLLDLWNQVHPATPIRSRISPYLTLTPPDEFIASLSARDGACRKFAWAVPTERALRAIAAHTPLIEIGAGTGYWAGLLSSLGADILAFDKDPPGPGVFNHWHVDAVQWFPVGVGGPDTIEAHPDRTLFLCWPPYDDPMATDCLRRYRGDVVLYVGEWGAATADEEFHALLERDFREPRVIAIPQWMGIHDSLHICRRR